MSRFRYYINYGSGLTEINPHKIALKLGWEKGVLNPVIQRKYLKGSFSLIETQAGTAYTYFITNSNFKAPFKIYEHGTNLTGTLIFDGYISISGEYDNNASVMQFDYFEITDEYTTFEEIRKMTIEGEQITGSSIDRFGVAGANTNGNKLRAFTFNGTTLTQAGNTYDLGYVGRLTSCIMGTKFVVFDDHTRTIRAFDFNGTDFTASATGTLLDLSTVLVANYGKTCLRATGATTVLLTIGGDAGIKVALTATTGTWTTSITYNNKIVNYPSECQLGSSTSIIADDKSKQIESSNGIVADLGDVIRPKICNIDTDKIALIDENILQLQAYQLAAGALTKLGTPLPLPRMVDPSICKVSTNVINIHDTYSGKVYYYSFSGTAWTQTGTGNSLSGGINSTISHDGTYLYVAITDNYDFDSRISPTFQGIIDSIFDRENITAYGFDAATCGATFPIEEMFLVNLDTLSDIGTPSGITPENKYKYSIDELLKIAEMFQNYWYLDYSGGVYWIKFKTPSGFSSVGSDIDVSAYASTLNQRKYNDNFYLKRERIILNNGYNEDFDATWITYNKNALAELETSFNFTTDIGIIVDLYTKRKNPKLSLSGLLLITLEADTYLYHVPYATSALGNTGVKNDALSISRIYENYMKDYRYAINSTFNLNGNNVAVQDTCRDVVSFPDVSFKSTNFIGKAASFNWGTYKSYITQVEVDLQSYKFTGQSILLDL